MEKYIHYDEDLEKAILGAIMIEPTAFGRCYGILTDDCFYFERHKWLFKTILAMWNKNEPVDMVTVCLRVNQAPESQGSVSDYAYTISDCVKNICSTANLEFHALILREMLIKRELLKMTTAHISGNVDALEELDKIEERIRELRQVTATDDFKSIDETIISLFNHMDKVEGQDVIGITTGFKTLDRINGGFMPGGTYIIGARPSVGKSALMGKMAISAAREGKNVAVISLEMEDESITARLASLHTDIEFSKIIKNRFQDQFESKRFYDKVQNEMAGLPIRISDTASVNMGDIKSKVAKLKSRGQIDILFLDYLQLVETDRSDRNANREQQIAAVSRGLKLMAMQMQIPVILLAQLNRGSDQNSDKKPKLSNLRESGSLEQDADGVMFIHRPFMVGQETNEFGQSTENDATLIIAKWRNGAIFDHEIAFDPKKMKFYEKDEFQQHQYLIEENPF